MHSFSAERRPAFASVDLLDLRHLHTLTDDVGILQHARYAIPDRNHGYCVDDNGRALIVAARHHALCGDEESLVLARRYVAFLNHAFNPSNGRFRNFMSYDRRWLEEEGSEDSHARALWGLGEAITYLPDHGLCQIALELIEQAAPATEACTSPRAWAYTLLGLYHYIEVNPDHPVVSDVYLSLASRLMESFERNCDEGWNWCEDILSYSNAMLPLALLRTGEMVKDRGMIDRALGALTWLLEQQTSPEGHLSIIGNEGWLVRSGERAQFDQQPVDAMALVLGTLEAYAVTSDEAWLHRAQWCHAWFTGANDLGGALVDETTGGCRDGLMRSGVNQNQGAESTLAWLIASLAVRERLDNHHGMFATSNGYANLARGMSASAFVRIGNGEKRNGRS